MADDIRFASALSFEADVKFAALELGAKCKRLLEDATPDLALVFMSSHFAAEAEAFVEALGRSLGAEVVVGCTGEGVIGEGHEIENKRAVALIAGRLPGATLHPFSLLPEEVRDVVDNPGQLPQSVHAGKDTKVFVMIGDPFTTPMDELLKVFNTAYAGVPVVGGMASGARGPGEGALVLNGNAFRQGVVGVAIAGAVDVDVIVSQGCRPIGPLFSITDSEANIIKTLEDKSSIERIQEVIDDLSDEDRTLLQNGLFVGRAIDSSKEMIGRGDFLVRGVVGIDRKTGAIAIGDFVETGETVQFHIRDADTAKEDLEMMLTPHSLFGAPGGAFLFSCNGRGTRLYDHPDGDVSALTGFFRDLHVAGFFCAGEIGPIGGRNFLHGHTASIALIRPQSTLVRDEA